MMAGWQHAKVMSLKNEWEILVTQILEVVTLRSEERLPPVTGGGYVDS